MLESLIAVFALGLLAGGLLVHLAYRHLHETRREIVRVHEHTDSALALREAFFSAACVCPSPQTLMADCPLHGAKRGNVVRLPEPRLKREIFKKGFGVTWRVK